MRKNTLIKSFFFFFVIFLFASSSWAEPKELIVLTFSDLHGQLEPFISEKNNNTLKTGGMARIASVVKTIKGLNKGKVVLFSSGDSLTGKYFLRFNGEAIFSAISLLGIEAATFGNHEFDRGTETLSSALKYCSFPVVESNLEITDNSSLKNSIERFKIINRNGIKIGVIGLMTPDLSLISKAGNSIAVDPDIAGSAINIIRVLKQKESPDLIVALTHLGLEEDIKLSGQVPEIDLICGGHSHDLMEKGKATVINHADGRKTIIIHAGARGEYLGLLSMAVEKGNILSHLWEPVRVTAKIRPDKKALDLIASYNKDLPKGKVLTILEKALDCRGETLRTQEAAAGNMIADTIREHFKVDIAFQNSGGIRGERIIPPGNITTEDIDTMLPFENRISILSLKGYEIKQVLEQSVSFLPLEYGGFLQVSGLRFDVDIDKHPFKIKKDKTSGELKIISNGKRISNIKILGPDRKYEPLIAERSYKVAINSFLASGGDKYFIFMDRKKMSTYITLRSIVKNRLNSMSGISLAKENRISYR